MALTRVFFMFDGFGIPPNTFTRTGATGTAVDEDGVIQTFAADILRTEWLDLDGDGTRETVSVLLEAGATNQLTDPDNIDPDGVAWAEADAWTQASAEEFVGGGTAIQFTNDGVTGSHHVNADTPNLLATPVVFSVIVENVDALTTSLGILDDTASQFVIRGTYTWATGAIVESDNTAGSSTGVRATTIAEVGPNGGKLVRLEVWGTADNVGNDGQVFIYPAGTSVNALSAILHHAQYEDGTVATSPVEGARDDELFQFPIGFTPADIVAAGGATFYSRWVERGTAFDTAANARYWMLGNLTDRIMLQSHTALVGGLRATATVAGGSDVTSSSAVGVVAIGDLVETLVHIEESGSNWTIQLTYSVNEAAAVEAIAGTIGASLPSAWDENTATIGAAFDGAAPGIAAHIAHKAVGGVKTMAEMRAMEPALVIQHYAIPISPGSLRKRTVEIGDKARTFDGTMRETIRSRVSELEAETTPLTLADRNTVLDVLESSTQPQTCYGSAVRKRDGTLPNVFTRPRDSTLVQSHNTHRYTVSFMAEESS